MVYIFHSLSDSPLRRVLECGWSETVAKQSFLRYLDALEPKILWRIFVFLQKLCENVGSFLSHVWVIWGPIKRNLRNMAYINIIYPKCSNYIKYLNTCFGWPWLIYWNSCLGWDSSSGFYGCHFLVKAIYLVSFTLFIHLTFIIKTWIWHIQRK